MNAHPQSKQPSSADIFALVSTADYELIRSTRLALGWSQAFVAQRAGTYQQQVDRVEKGLVTHSRIVPAIMAALGITDILPRNTPSRVSALRDEIETAYDLLTALDKTGDGIGGDVGHGVSAVALAARAALDNARSMLKAMEASR